MYDVELVERLVPTIWDRSYAWGMTDSAPDEGKRIKRNKPKNEGNTLWAHLADIRVAWNNADLTTGERRALLLIGGLGLRHGVAGAMMGISQQAATARYGYAVKVLTDYLNGERKSD